MWGIACFFKTIHLDDLTSVCVDDDEDDETTPGLLPQMYGSMLFSEDKVKWSSAEGL